MPYQSIDELPESVKSNLPKHAQEIYKSAFNNAIAQYGEEDRAHATSWSAVKSSYKKDENGNWVEKENK